MTIPVVTALNNKNFSEINAYQPYLLTNNLEVEQHYPECDGLNQSGYDMQAFASDNQNVKTWFSGLQETFNQWLADSNKPSISIELTGSRSFNASYTESDLECAIVSDNFNDFLAFCQFLHASYRDNHHFLAIKTQAGLPLLIIKGNNGFCCPELSRQYPGKSLPQLEITFRHPSVHNTIQEAGNVFFASLNTEQLTSYVFNKRYIALMQNSVSPDVILDGQSLKTKVLEQFKSALSQPLKCLPAGVLQETPVFNQQVFAQLISASNPLTTPAFFKPAIADSQSSSSLSSFCPKI